MKITNTLKILSLTTIMTAGATGIKKVNANETFASNTLQTERTDTFKRIVSPEGTDDISVLSNAPSPNIVIAGKNKKAAIVVDVDNHTLYHYDKNGKPLKAYLVATGRKGTKRADGKILTHGTPTEEGISVVSHIEKYPYRTAPRNTKRRQTPGAFGRRALILLKVNPKTGETSSTGQFVHGNGDKSSLGKSVSHACIRMDNDVVEKEIAPNIERGMYVVFINSSPYEIVK